MTNLANYYFCLDNVPTIVCREVDDAKVIGGEGGGGDSGLYSFSESFLHVPLQNII